LIKKVTDLGLKSKTTLKKFEEYIFSIHKTWKNCIWSFFPPNRVFQRNSECLDWL